MTPTPGTRPVSSVGLATIIVDCRPLAIKHILIRACFKRQNFMYGRLSICFSSGIFHSCNFHSRIFSVPECILALIFNPISHPSNVFTFYKKKSYFRYFCSRPTCTFWVLTSFFYVVFAILIRTSCTLYTIQVNGNMIGLPWNEKMQQN